MKAVVYDRYGPPEVLHIQQVEKPVPHEDEVLIRVRAVAVTRGDCATRDANRHSGAVISILSRSISGMRRPRQRILGSEFAGEVESVGMAVKEFAAGDRVFGSTGFRFGGHAEYVCVKEAARVTQMPRDSTFEQAAAIGDGGNYALESLRTAEVRKGQTVLVYGASGAIGTAGVQLAKHLGATVTAVCGTKNVELVTSLGADTVIDYTREDFTRSGQTYDVIFDAVGKTAFARCRDSLKAGGRFAATDGLANLVLSMWTSRFGSKRVVFRIPPRLTKQDMVFLKELVEGGAFRPVIDRTYSLEDVVEAARYVETEQKVGNVILHVA